MRRFAVLALAAGCAIPGESPQMEAGNDCMSCHDGARAQSWTVAGTLYQDPASGADAGVEGAKVYIQDSAGNAFTLTTNAAGNFYTAEALRFPIHVQAEVNGRRMAMVDPPKTGSCNSCHAQPAAEDAPGRLYIPPP